MLSGLKARACHLGRVQANRAVPLFDTSGLCAVMTAQVAKYAAGRRARLGFWLEAAAAVIAAKTVRLGGLCV